MILAIETSQVQGEVALGDGEIPTLVQLSPGLVHGRELQPRIAEIVASLGIGPSALGLIAVSAGPGSYTGLRIGVATAKALAWGLGKPALAVSTLETIAQNVSEPGPFAVVLDARRGDCYGARFHARETDDGRVSVERLGADQILPLTDFLASLEPATRLVGDGAAAVAAADDRFSLLPFDWNLPRAAEVYRLARRRWRDIREGREAPPAEFLRSHALVPCYLRAPLAQSPPGRRPEGGASGDRNSPQGAPPGRIPPDGKRN